MTEKASELYQGDFVGDILLNWRINAVLPFIDGKLLDVGCGDNRLAHTYHKRSGNAAIGVDIFPWKGVDKVIESAGDMPFDAGEFDTISCIAAFNHIPNRMEMLVESKRILRQGGKLILTMIPPTISRIWHFIRSPWDHDQQERGMDEGEEFGFSKKQVQKYLNEAGFKLVNTKKFMLHINSIYVAESL